MNRAVGETSLWIHDADLVWEAVTWVESDLVTHLASRLLLNEVVMTNDTVKISEWQVASLWWRFGISYFL